MEEGAWVEITLPLIFLIQIQAVRGESTAVSLGMWFSHRSPPQGFGGPWERNLVKKQL